MAERAWNTLVDTAKAMLAASTLPTEFWGYALKHAAMVRNMVPTLAKDCCMPFKLLTGAVPDITPLRKFGCAAYSAVEREARRKWDGKSPRHLRGVFAAEQDTSGVLCGHQDHGGDDGLRVVVLLFVLLKLVSSQQQLVLHICVKVRKNMRTWNLTNVTERQLIMIKTLLEAWQQIRTLIGYVGLHRQVSVHNHSFAKWDLLKAVSTSQSMKLEL